MRKSKQLSRFIAEIYNEEALLTATDEYGDEIILQIEIQSMLANKYLVIKEVINRDAMSFENAQSDPTINEYREVRLNTDPFGDHKHSGQTLGHILDTDKSWCEMAVKQLKNEYIRIRLEYLLKGGNI